MTPPAAQQDKPQFLPTLKEAAFFAAVYLYFAGYVYIYYYYNSFGISLNALDIPIYYFFVYAFNVFVSLKRWGVWRYALGAQWAVILVIGILSVVTMIVLRKWKLRVLVVALLILLFPMTFSFALKAGESDAANVRGGNYVRPITLAFKDEAMKIFPQATPATNAGARPVAKKALDAKIRTPADDDQCWLQLCSGEANSDGAKPADANCRLPEAQPTPERLSLARLLDSNSQKFSNPCDTKCRDKQGTVVGKGDPTLWLIGETKDHLYVFYQPWPCRSDSTPSGYVYEVSKSDVTFSEVTVR